MRRALIVTVIALSLTAAACSPYDTPAGATPVSPKVSISSPPVTRGYAILYAVSVRSDVPCDRACWEAVKIRQQNERLWWAEVVAQQRRRAEAARIARIYAFAHAVEQARLARLTGHCYIEGVRVCDGPGLLPHYIVWRESRMNPRARNPRSSAGGYAQMLIGTMRSVCPAEAARYGNAAYAPVSVQVECVRRLIARHGLSPWRL